MIRSFESRWFLDTQSNAAETLRRWFDADNVAAERDRTDDYLAAGRIDVGFKVRDRLGAAKFETKVLQGSLGITRFTRQIAGALEVWQKLSLEGVQGLAAETDWFSTKKVRRLRKFAYELGSVHEVGTKTKVTSGCGIELTDLSWATGSCVTFGIEAFGPDVDLLACVIVTMAKITAALPQLELPAKSSESYPQWVARQTRETIWTHRLVRDTEYYSTSPSQGRAADGTIPAGMRCAVTVYAGIYARVSTEDERSGYVDGTALEVL